MTRGKVASTTEGILGKKRVNNGKSERFSHSARQPPKCPECGSKRIWKDGLRYLQGSNPMQRYLCRSCGFRFSFSQTQNKVNVLSKLVERFKPRANLAHSRICDADFSLEERLNRSSFTVREDVASHGITVIGKGLNSFPSYNSKRQVCVNEKKMKNLVKVEPQLEKAGAGATTADAKGKIIEYGFWLKKNGRRESTIRTYMYQLELLSRHGTNIFDPESVKEAIANLKRSESYKLKICYCYDTFLRMLGKTWEMPRYKAIHKIPFIPKEQTILQIISGCGKKTATFVRFIYETGARSGEVANLEWNDIDFERRIVNITAEKNSNPRILPISNELVGMLKRLPRKNKKVFGDVGYNVRRTVFLKTRKILAKKLNNPDIERVTFHSIRHWKGTMEYHRTRDIEHVKEVLGHKSIVSTDLYIHLEKTIFANQQEDQWICKVAKTVGEATKLIEVGFEYVNTMKDGIALYRKRK